MANVLHCSLMSLVFLSQKFKTVSQLFGSAKHISRCEPFKLTNLFRMISLSQ
jgi:hypothetical protein